MDEAVSGLAPLKVADRCDQCGAQAYIRVRMPSGSELLFCGHHGRSHAPALAAQGADVRDDTHLING
ncbi:hypothetical protein G9H71_03830 [Motilibacter sp. E257]|uniref:DUF7455 domain-containing protein n=1 Tax=Motilibacter deserti TaxID=2714956 RepID=A0ABX0GTB7_9ACTN|nr:hypothetical protein [Motilibacter deserti]